jgi:hypothetical protein
MPITKTDLRHLRDTLTIRMMAGLVLLGGLMVWLR